MPLILIAINLSCCLHDDEKNNLEKLEDALRDTGDTGYTRHTGYRAEGPENAQFRPKIAIFGHKWFQLPQMG